MGAEKGNTNQRERTEALYVEECEKIAGLHVQGYLQLIATQDGGRWSFSVLHGAALSAHHGHLFIAAAARLTPRMGEEKFGGSSCRAAFG